MQNNYSHRFIKLLLFFIVLFGATNAYTQQIIYVDSAAAGVNNGNSWVDAYTDLHFALFSAQPGDQVWVAKGTYAPVKDEFNAIPSDDRMKTFSFPNDSVKIYGGFNGTETHLSQRKWRENPSILSGKQANDSVSSTVFFVDNKDQGSTLDGFIIEKGEDKYLLQSALPGTSSPGILCLYSEMIFSNLIIRNNFGHSISGMDIFSGLQYSNYRPVLINIEFYNNVSSTQFNVADPVIRIRGSRITMINISVHHNVIDATSIYMSNCKGTVHNLTVDQNILTWSGTTTGQVGGYGCHDSPIQFYNCILTDGGRRTPQNIMDSTQVPTIHHSMVTNPASSSPFQTYEYIGINGGGNINLPWPTFRIDSLDMRLASCSRGINEGLNAYLPYDTLDMDHDGITNEPFPIDILGNPRISDSTIDMGAFEYQAFPGGIDSSTYYICQPETHISIKGESLVAGNYLKQYTSREGCDSTVQLIIHSQAVDTSMQFLPGDSTLFASATGADFQWMDCNTGQIIFGANDSVFTGSTGTYAAIINQNGCVDTSACFSIERIGITESPLDIVGIYPNPSRESFTLQFAEPGMVKVLLTDVRGNRLKNFTIRIEDEYQLETSDLSPGIYLLQIEINGKLQTHSLVKL